MKESPLPEDLYTLLAQPSTHSEDEDEEDPPGTLHTAAVETIDNDRAGGLLGPVGP